MFLALITTIGAIAAVTSAVFDALGYIDRRRAQSGRGAGTTWLRDVIGSIRWRRIRAAVFMVAVLLMSATADSAGYWSIVRDPFSDLEG
ncbi:hypothetical protein F4560_001274 [Saccharothrix ecbatanensis]|uniref:Uncharacterized protein n=1 Tax=Saccharothrix ecbatanensis TaxID=1105145 RepID=A0A7W9LZ63_9PSEU|nr:hypothetical protein [Saccharothrix ecbatanensis]MBB5801506.1 hypothetical protein [Saccharothrix ecbatanensis]